MRAEIFVVTGANSGLGQAVCKALENGNPLRHIIPVGGPDWSDVSANERPANALYGDLTDPEDNHRISCVIKDRTHVFVGRAMEAANFGDVEVEMEVYPVLINCAGVNYIEWFDHADFSQFDRLMKINVKAGLMLTQNLIGMKPPFDAYDSEDWFRGTGAILNIVSNASHVPMTNSAFYNASKGAFHIATLAMARELRKTHGICVFGISPNKLAGTGMSDYIEGRVPSLRGWSAEEAAKYQLAALPAGEETDPVVLAEFIAYLMADPRNHKFLTNTVIPYGA